MERRAQYLSVYWQEHFSRSRAAQARWAQECRGDLLTVLGAGPLYDFNAAALTQRFKNLRLVDANPLSKAHWARLHVPVESVITDISNCMGNWVGQVSKHRGTWEQALRAIEELAATPVRAYSVSTNALLSLNILSQLEVGWQEAVEPVLRKRFGSGFVTQHEQEWLNAIRPGSRSLAEQHLSAMEQSGAQSILLICDVEYFDYTGRQYSRQFVEPPPTQWTEAGWQPDEGIQFQVRPALEGVELNQDCFAKWMPSYRLEWRESWLWHISPCGIESPEGTLHRVAAFALHREADSA